MQKAQFGAKMAYELIAARAARTAEAQPVDTSTSPHAKRRATVAAARSTLKPGDLEPAWREPMARRGG